MEVELQNKLYAKYPEIFRDRDKSMSESCMYWGCDVNSGWYHILDYMCKRLVSFQNKYGVTVVFDQVKEKFGSIRVYHHVEYGARWSEQGELDGAVEVEHESFGWSTCGQKMPARDGVERLVDEVIRVAEEMSSITCEECGVTGATQNDRGWIKTLCDKCRSKNEKTTA